jgi:hypothetical protein
MDTFPWNLSFLPTYQRPSKGSQSLHGQGAMADTVEEKPAKLFLFLFGSTLGLVAGNRWQRFALAPHVQTDRSHLPVRDATGHAPHPAPSHFDSQTT